VLPTNSFFGLIFLDFDAHILILSRGLKFRCVPRCCLVGGKEGLLVGGGEDGGVCVWGRSSGVSNQCQAPEAAVSKISKLNTKLSKFDRQHPTPNPQPPKLTLKLQVLVKTLLTRSRAPVGSLCIIGNKDINGSHGVATGDSDGAVHVWGFT